MATSSQASEKTPSSSLIPTAEQISAVFRKDGLSPGTIRDVTAGVDDPRIKALAKLAILKVFRYFHEDPRGFGLIIPRKDIVVTDEHDRPLYTVAEHYEDSIPAVMVAPPAYFKDTTVRGQLERRYGLSRSASPDYIIGYLAAHSTVHHIQHLQHRVDKAPDRITDIETDSLATKRYRQLPSEREAHAVGLRTIKGIWKELFSTN